VVAGVLLGPVVVALLTVAGAAWHELVAVAGVAGLIVLGSVLRGRSLSAYVLTVGGGVIGVVGVFFLLIWLFADSIRFG